MRKHKKSLCGFVLSLEILLLTACGQAIDKVDDDVANSTVGIDTSTETLTAEATEQTSTDGEAASPDEVSTEELQAEASYINPEGMTIESRIIPPEGFERISAEQGSFAELLRNYPVKEDGSPVLLYNGKEKGNQSAHIAVTALPIASEDLQQCADSVMRMYAEYFYATGQYERIVFHFTNGFAAEYTKWREGYRISVNGNQVSWVKSAEYDDSYETFAKYLRIVFVYAGTLSMKEESEEISLEEVQAGDVFLMGGSPGHVVMIADVCENKQGERAFLLAQGYMPAQEFHVLKNPAHENNPWYYEEEITYPLRTPEYTFSEGSLRRLKY